MAIPWLTVLQSVPWGEVVANAPKIADGAARLWKTVLGRDAKPGKADTASHALRTTQPATPEELAQRLAELESANQALHAQMQASSELIKALAEQNAGLIRRIDANRRGLRWLLAGVLLSCALSIAALIHA